MIKEKEQIDRRLIVAGGIILLLIVVIVAASFARRTSAPGEAGEPTGGFAETETRRVVPSGTVVPEVGEEVRDSNIAVPTVSTSAAPGAQAKFRAFSIKAERGRFDPSRIIVNKGDTVNIVVEAIDRDYDFTLPDFGLKQVIARGERKVVEFQAVNEGEFVYYCDVCGGLDSSSKGTITVVP